MGVIWSFSGVDEKVERICYSSHPPLSQARSFPGSRGIKKLRTVERFVYKSY